MKIKKSIEERENENTNIFQENNGNFTCYDLMNNHMSLALSKYYAEKIFTENDKSESMNMMENIRNAMIYRIKELEWLDESTREYAIKKILNIKYILGYTDNILNTENLYNKYKFFEPIENDDPMFLMLSQENVNNYKIFQNIYNENYKEIEEQNYEITDINAYYSPNENLMIFPAAILQSPNFDINQPDYISYGNIGSTMGHELTHAFDDSGKNFDAEGKEFNWWTDNDSEEFEEFSQCFIDQYNSYSFELKGEKYNVNGKRTLGENLADNGGLDRAYEAWKLSIENNPEKAKERNKLLPGLSNYTMDQLFYIYFAHYYCNVGVTESAIRDVHSPGKFRVNGSVSNSERFAKIFKCPKKSPMNPDIKCVLW
ncbi:zincin [Anaeromyces robustus]|uniref:Zincin n=1 Tax=Anaeromyces robustus TaxID=1754192 RepID=A0A1Y1VYS1_9FUNG|nr:zincin [Anaeromyces robustus]|eukprot:ORX65984.1 zincin [Anaeromyces robustus]